MRASWTLPLALCVACSDYDLQTQGEKDPAPIEDSEEVADTPNQPDIAVNPGSIDFGFWPAECEADREVFTVTNEGERDLEVYSIELNGSDSSVFSLDLGSYSSGGTRTLVPGETVSFDAGFIPVGWTEFEARIEVISNDPDEATASVDLLGNGAEDYMMEELFTQPSAAAVDVLWVIDNSGSMSSEVGVLGDHFLTFISAFDDMGVDYQIGVVTTDMDNTAQAGKLQGVGVISSALSDPVAAFVAAATAGAEGSGDERGLDASNAALSEPLISGANAGLIREDAILAVVVITDEADSSNISPTSYASWLDAYKATPEMSNFSAMAGPESGLWPCIDMATGVEATPAPDYAEVVNTTGGLYSEICDMDFDEVLLHLSFAAAGLATEFPLSSTPTSIGGITITIDGVDVEYSGIEGFTWDSSTNSIIFHGSTRPGPEAEVLITYPVETECY